MFTDAQPWRGIRTILAPENVLGRIVLTLVLIATAAALTTGAHRLTGENTSIFYLSAAVLATWAWGIGAGALVVIAGSMLTMHAPADPPAEWHWNQPAAWARLSMFTSIALAFAVLIDRVRTRSRELAQTVQKLQTVLDLAPVGIAIADDRDVESSPVHVNQALARLLGEDTREAYIEAQRGGRFTFRSDGEAVPYDRLPIHQAISSRATSPPVRVDLVRNGRTAHVVAQAAPLLQAGVPRGAVATYVDVTEAYERERQLTRANRAKDEFLGIVSHELNTPLTIIAGNVEILRRRWPGVGEPIERILQDLQDATDDLRHNVQDLLLLAKAGDRMLDLEQVALCGVIERTVEPHRSAGHDIRVQCRDAVALGVPHAVQQVINNLVSNAEKYSPPGAPIEISATSLDGQVIVTVRDRGFGLGEDELDAVFLPFYRSTRTPAAAGGMGIGLSVCKHLVAAMGGRIWAAQRDGGGTEFGFTLSGAPAHERVEPVQSSACK